MIHINETSSSQDTVIIQLEGRLDSESLASLEDVYQKHLSIGQKVILDLESLNSIDRHGKDFLRKIRNNVRYIGLSEYLSLEIGDGSIET